MKKFLFAIAAVAAMVACNPDDSKLQKTVSFVNPFPEMQNYQGVFKVVVSNYTATEPLEIPVIFGGTAEKGVDYEVSAESFVWGGESPVTEISVTPLVLASDKELTLALSIPDGFVAGQYPISSFSFSGKLGYASFESNADSLVGGGEITVNIVDGNGSGLNLPDGAEIAVEVDTENSTAVEGTHFQFVGDKKAVVIPAGKKKGTVAVEALGAFDAEHNKIVLKIADDRFYIGDYESVEISLNSYWAQLAGTWQVNELITDKAFFLDAYMADETQLVGFPEFNESDRMTFDIANNKFIPQFTSEFKNYFIGESNIVNAGGYTITVGMGTKVNLQYVLFDNTNRNFSANSTSEDKESYVGFQIFADETNGEDVLDMYVIDYLPTDFLTHYADYGMWDPTKPVATTTYAYLQATFKRVAE